MGDWIVILNLADIQEPGETFTFQSQGSLNINQPTMLRNLALLLLMYVYT